MQETISIIIPVYNVKPYLSECLQSVVDQTYPALEIILVDDGSTDGSGQLCDEWAGKDDRIKVIHKANGGVSSARNEGLKASTGDYIGFVDSDDWCEPEMFEKLCEALKDADGASCGFMEYPMNTLDIAVHIGKRETPPCNIADAVTYIYERDGYFTSIWNKLFRRETVFPNGRLIAMDPSLAFGEDEVWLSRVLRRCRSFAFVPEPLYHWRPREGSASRFDRVTDRQMTVLKSKQLAMENLPQDESVQNLVKSRMYNDCFSLKAQAYCTGDRERYRIIAETIAPMRRYWLRSGDPTILRKGKVLLMELAMALRLPGPFVWKIDSIRRFGIKG